MTLAEVQTFVVRVIKGSFLNKKTLDKLSTSDDGNLLFDGNEIKGGSNITISEQQNNAIEQKEDGIYVKDKSQDIQDIKDNIQTVEQNIVTNTQKLNALNYAQKVSEEKAFIEDILWDTPTRSTNKLPLTKPFNDYDEFIITAVSTLKISNANISQVNAVYLKNDIIPDKTIQFNIVTWGNAGSTASYNMLFHFTSDNCIQIDDLGSSTLVKVVGRKYNQLVIDPVEHVNQESGIEDTPVGHIIAHMGNTAPKHYLKCDGTIYNITDYPYLAEFIKTEFGSYNYFDGDGTTTFAVPDLQGEFLRGTGTNSHENMGSGSNVGVHQDATTFAVPLIDTRANQVRNGYYNPINYDSTQKVNGSYVNATRVNDLGYIISARPTNTSVLYCIKYEPTYYLSNQIENLNIQGYEDYSEDEIVIGKWIDGKPVYRKVIKMPDQPSKNASVIIDITNLNIEKPIKCYGFCKINGNSYWTSGYKASNDIVTFIINGNSLIYYAYSFSGLAKDITAIIEYTKTTDKENDFTPDMLSNIVIPLNSGESSKPEESLTEEEINAMIEEDYNILKE